MYSLLRNYWNEIIESKKLKIKKQSWGFGVLVYFEGFADLEFIVSLWFEF